MSSRIKMWEALKAFQPYANKHAFGEAWERMTTDRTEKSAKDVQRVIWQVTKLEPLSVHYAREAADCAVEAITQKNRKVAFWARMSIWHVKSAIEFEAQP